MRKIFIAGAVLIVFPFLLHSQQRQIDFKPFFLTKSWPLVSPGFNDDSVSVETGIFYKNPPSIKIDCGKTKTKVVSLTFYLIRENFQLFKGKNVCFRAKIKRLSGNKNPFIQVRFYNLDEKEKKYTYLFGKTEEIKISGSEWADVSFTTEIPAQENVNAANFQIYVNNSQQPSVFLIDECVITETGIKKESENKTEKSVSFFLPSAVDDSPLEIVKDGKAIAVIVISPDPTPTVKYAVEELNEHIKLSTKTTLKIVTDEKETEVPAIHIGETKLSKKLGLSPDILPPDTWVIKRAGNCLIISGGDNNLNIHPLGKNLVPFGTLYATYEFLERFVGVRWYWPGNDGRFVPEHKNIIVNSVNLQGSPSYETRYVFYGIPEGITVEDAWKWWRRMRLGGVSGNPFGMHSFTDWNEKYGKQHPEWFALQLNGERLNEPQDDEHKKGHLCYTNSEVIDKVIEEGREKFNSQPDLKYFTVMPGDSNERYYCQCKNCQSMVRQNEVEGKKYSYAIWSFVNKIAEEIRKTHPDRFISCCAYNGYRIPPEDVYFQPNVAVTFCVPEHLRNPWADDVKKKYVDEIVAWNKKVQNLYVWDYWLYRWSPGVYGAPAIYPHLLSEIYLLEQGRVKGHVIELCNKDDTGILTKYWQNWIMDQINVYAGFKLLWNSNQNVDEILDDYYKFFGPAEQLIRKFYESMEYAFLNPATKEKNTWDWETCWNKTYTGEFVNQVMGYLKEAEKLTRGNEPYHTRVEKVLKGFLPFELASKKYSSGVKKTEKNKSITVVEIKSTPVIDGKLNEPCWQNASIADNFVDLYNNNCLAQTKFLLLHDGKNFYIGIRAFLPERKIKKYQKEGIRDGTIWDSESCELFFSPDGIQCYQFLIGPGNVFTDLYVPDIKKFTMEAIKWNATGIEYSTSIENEFWTAEIKIPFTSINFTPGSQWLVNFCRNYYYFVDNKNSWAYEASSWQAVFGSFHNISMFGTLNIKMEGR